MSAGRLERAIGLVFRIGISISSISLAVGLLLSFTTATALGGTFLQIGLIVLLATPAVRVLVSAIEYVLERDWTFAILTTIVLVELAASVVAAVAHG